MGLGLFTVTLDLPMKLLWNAVRSRIDFRSARFAEQSVVRFRQDMMIFVKSCFISSMGSQLPLPPQVVKMAVHAYSPTSPDTITVLIIAVKGSLP